jgi:ssDNA-binding Zn-finger/Zn-ribbon topoisomerase 1
MNFIKFINDAAAISQVKHGLFRWMFLSPWKQCHFVHVLVPSRNRWWHMCSKFPNRWWTINISKWKIKESYGKESGETLSLIVEPNCGPPLRYEMRNSIGYPFSLCGTIPRSLNVKAASQTQRQGTQKWEKERNNAAKRTTLTYWTNHFLTQLNR